MKLLKRTLAMLLVLTMVLGMVPFAAFAEETTEGTEGTLPVPTHMATKPADGTVTGQPFNDDESVSKNYRIPGLVNHNGTLIATADVRYDEEYDGGGIDIVVSRSVDGNTWNYTFPAYLGDNGNEHAKESSTLMDPLIISDGTKLYLLYDMFTAGYSIHGDSNTTNSFWTGETGFDANGRLRLGQTYDARDEASWNYYLENGQIKDSDGNAVAGYTVDAWFNVYQNGTYVSNLFFAKGSPFYAYPTSYIAMQTSSDNGETWTDPQLLNIKRSGAWWEVLGPGTGLVTKDGNLAFTAYDGSYIYLIYGKENNWKTVQTSAANNESSIVELADGTIRAFVKNNNNQICYVDFTKTETGYTAGSAVNTGRPSQSWCMVSSMLYSRTLGGKDVILVTCPTSTGGRHNGKMHMFTVNDDANKTMNYVGAYEINGANDFFAYSDMAELADGKIALLYEDGCKYYNGNNGVGYSHIKHITVDLEKELGLVFDAPKDVFNWGSDNDTVEVQVPHAAGVTHMHTQHAEVNNMNVAYSAYEIVLCKDAQASCTGFSCDQTHTGKAIVTLPLTESLKNAAGVKGFVVEEDDGSITSVFNVKKDETHVTFEAPHFSVVGIAAMIEEEIAQQNTEEITLYVGETKNYTIEGVAYTDADVTKAENADTVVTTNVVATSTDGEKYLGTANVTAITSGKTYVLYNKAAQKLMNNAWADASVGGGGTDGLGLSSSKNNFQDRDCWKITAVEGVENGYYVQDMNNKYLSVARGKAQVKDQPVVINLNFDNTDWTIGENGEYLNDFGGAHSAVAGWSDINDKNSQWEIYEVNTTAAENTTVTFTGLTVGTTRVIVGNTQYNITVSYREVPVVAYIGTTVSVTPSGTITQDDIDAFNTAHSGKVSIALTDGKLVFTGIAEESEFTVILGNTRYRVMTTKVVENITLYPGLARTFTIDGFNYDTDDVTFVESDSASLESISGTAAGSAQKAVKVTKIESGKQYIFVNSRAAKTLTNTATGNRRLTLAGTKELLDANAIWNVESTDGGYFVTDAKGKYLTVGDGTAHAVTTAHTIALNFNGAAWTISELSHYLNDYNNLGNQVSGYDESTDPGSLWQIYEVVPVGASTEVTFKGVTAGTTTTAVVGHVTYNITVLAQEVRDITLYVGVTQNDFIDGYTYTDANVTKQPDNTYAYIHSATAENGGTKVVFSGVAEGTTDTATVGHVKYNITVKSLRSGGDLPDFNCVAAEKTYHGTNLANKEVNSLRITAGAKFDLGVDVTGYDSIAWTTADPTVATVDTTGQVTAVAVGTTLVTATVSKNGIEESISVHVTVVPSMVEGCNADQIASVVFYTEEVYKTDPFYTLFLSSENETGPVAEHTMVMSMEGQVIYLERPKAAAYAMVWTADPWDQHALTYMAAVNTAGQYYPLQSSDGVVGVNKVGDTVYFKCTLEGHSTQDQCPNRTPYHNVGSAGATAGASWQAALDELLEYNAHIGEGIWEEFGCDGIMLTSRTYNNGSPNVATAQSFISDKLPEVTKVVDGVLPVNRKFDYYRRYDPNTSPVVVATIGEQVYFKITVTLERPHAMQVDDPSLGSNIYTDALLTDVMKDVYGNPVNKDIGFFYTKELDNEDNKWDGVIPETSKTQTQDLTTWLNAPWGDNEEKRVKELYFLYTIQHSDLNRTELGNQANLNYSYSSRYSSGVKAGGAVANAGVLITGKMLDPAVIDFGESIRGEIFADQLGNAVRGEAKYGTVDIRGNLLTYTPNAILQNMDTVTLYDAGGKLINSLIVYPATTVYYEEDFLVKENSGWTLGGTNTIVGSNGFQTLEKLGATLYDTSGQYIETITDKKQPYGYDPMYQNNIGASGGTYAEATAVGATTSFTFTGTGFDLYANCKLDTGYVAVTLKDANGKAVKMYTVNTVLKDAQSETEEYNLPIVSELALPHGTYTVEVRKIVNDGKKVRLDGVRIYNTLEDTSYFDIDLEAYPLFFELRDYVLKALKIGYSEQYDTATGIANQVYGLLNGDSASAEKPTNVSAVVLDTAKPTSRDIQATKVNIEYHDGGRYEQIIVQGIYKEYDAVGNTVVKETVEDICDLAKFMTKDGQITAEPNSSGVKNRTETPIICDKVEVTTTTTTYADGVTSEETVVDAITGAQTTEIFKIIVNRYGNDIVALEANVSAVVNQESEKTVFESKQSTTTAQELLDNGPKNELFLYPGQSLTFNVNTSRMLQLGLKAPLAATNYSLQYVVGDKTTVVADNQALNSSVDMFYNLQNLPKVNIATSDKVTITSTSGRENTSQENGAAALVDGNKSTLYKFHDAQLTDEESIIMTYDAARIMDTMVITFEKKENETLNYAFTYSIRAYNADGTYDIIADRVTANRTNNNSQTYTFMAKAYPKVEIVMHSCKTGANGENNGWPAVAEFEIYGTERAPLTAPVTHTVTVENNGTSILSVTKLKISDDPNGNLVPLTVADIRQALLASGYPADEEEETPDADPTVPMETQPVETQPVETQPVETKPAVTEPENAFGCTKDIDCVLSQFTDTDANEWYHDGVHFCVAEGLMNGMGEGIFAPNDPTTRAQLVTMLYRLMGNPKAEGKTEPFTDVAEGEWYYDAIVWAYSENVVKGISETEFAPNANVTREQVATILHRFLATPEGAGKLDSFSDAASVSDYAEDALVWAVGEGLINGVAQTDGKVLLDPTGTATRAQIATILYRYLENA